MSFLKYFRFSREAKRQNQRPAKVNSAGWIFYSCLPCAESWPAQQAQDWVMAKGTKKVKLDYQGISCSGTELIWHNSKTGEDRRPHEKNFKVFLGIPFGAAGKFYWRVQHLVAKRWESDSAGHWALDCYGRKVFCVFEQFPCFDSYDSMSEDRYYRWVYLCENGVLTRICTTDNYKDQKVYITEDVAFLENSAWEEMERAGYLRCR